MKEYVDIEKIYEILKSSKFEQKHFTLLCEIEIMECGETPEKAEMLEKLGKEAANHSEDKLLTFPELKS